MMPGGGGRGGIIDEVPFLKQLITSLSVTCRPDLMVLVRKGSTDHDSSKYKSHETGGGDDSGSEGGGSGGRGSVSSVVDALRGGNIILITGHLLQGVPE